jgi:hypothetical protein
MDHFDAVALVFIIMALGCVVSSCEKEDDIPEQILLNVAPGQIAADHSGGHYDVSVVAGRAWATEVSDASWLECTRVSDSSARISVKKNETEEERTGTVTFKIPNSPETENRVAVYITQEATVMESYRLTTSMAADESLLNALYPAINTHMRQYGFDYTEHPHFTGPYGSHNDGVHCLIERDNALTGKYAYRFNIHIDPVIDGDNYTTSLDRQRNEMKSVAENNVWSKVQGNWDEWQLLEWKFKINAGFQPTPRFTHIHQLKAQDGPHNGNPVITLTLRANSNGTGRRVQIVHTVDGDPNTSGKGTIVDNIPLSEFENEWIEAREECHYRHDGYYSIKLTRMRDGKVLMDFKDENIDLWRTGSSFIRSKFGIYRHLDGGLLNQTPVGQNPLLRNESVWLADFRIYERNTNPNPSQPHD